MSGKLPGICFYKKNPKSLIKNQVNLREDVNKSKQTIMTMQYKMLSLINMKKSPFP